MQLCHFHVQTLPAALPQSSDLKPVDRDPFGGYQMTFSQGSHIRYLHYNS